MIYKNIIYDYYFCKYKAFLKYHKTNGLKHNLAQFEQNKIAEKESFIISQITSKGNYIDLKNKSADQLCFTQNFNLIQNVTFSNKVFSISVHLKSSKNPKEIGFLYSPVFFIPVQRIKKEHKLFVTSCMLIINNCTQHVSQDCLVYYCGSDNHLKVQTKHYRKEAESGLLELSSIVQEPPLLHLSNKCPLCEYRIYCNKLAENQDNLSLLKGLGLKEIGKIKDKGIFTVHQYSFTFRPRKKRKKNTVFFKKHHYALQALAIRTNKIYIYSTTKIPISKNKIFIDIEFLQEDQRPYLIGLVIMNGAKLVRHSIWVNEITEYKNKVEQFLKIINKYKDFQIYHFGQSEHKFFEAIFELDILYKNVVERILEKSVNVLAIIYGNIYFPTYSNSLKNIASYLGFKWTTQNATGLDAIYWRKHWLDNRCEKTKEELIQYNLDDCLALQKVTNFIISVFQNEKNKYPDLAISTNVSEDLPSRYGGRNFGSHKFFVKDFEQINKCAYFDYQQNKVFIRTNSALKKQKKRRRQTSITINKKIIIHKARVCPKCKSENLRIAIRRDCKKIIVQDLLFFKGGIKKWNIEYTAQYQNCQNCRKVILPQKFLNLRSKYGHNLMSWLVYQSIVNQISYRKSIKMLEDIFKQNYNIEICYLQKIAVEFYLKTYNSLRKQILLGDIIHVDETTVNLRNGKGYVWIFTNINTVFYLFRRNRKTDFMKELLKGFKGVLISDFYKGYDGLNCKHQKCLIHLMRDVNNLLFKNQQNDAINNIANNFGKLLRVIVDTIDKYGLKTRHLSKHKNDVKSFYKKLEYITTDNAEIQTMIKRLFKYRGSLFTFLNFDGIPWNNNNAEHGFTHFAIYRKQANGLFTEDSIGRYLCFLSIYQTCSYRDLSFLHFLRSKEKFIINYQEKYDKDGNKKRKSP